MYDEWMLKTIDPRPYDVSPKVHPSIIFQNSHYITESSRPVVPSLVDVGGIHLQPPKSIPQVSKKLTFSIFIKKILLTIP